jgi:succinoglycan biosynthesis transport protein ExoP
MIWRRRKKVILISFSLIFCTCISGRLVLPSIYESRVMIIVENQEIPEEYVKSTTTSYISERLELLERKILSYPRLLKIINTNNLYPELSSNGEMVGQFREDITLETIDVTLNDSRFGRGLATIAFTLSYQLKTRKKQSR